MSKKKNKKDMVIIGDDSKFNLGTSLIGGGILAAGIGLWLMNRSGNRYTAGDATSAKAIETLDGMFNGTYEPDEDTEE